MQNKISIHHYNRYLFGGAAIAAMRIFNSLKVYDTLDLKFYSKATSNESGYFLFENETEPSLFSKISNKIPFLKDEKYSILKQLPDYLRNEKGKIQDFNISFSHLQTTTPNPLPDILHFHWMALFLDFPSFFKSVPNNIPLVWTLHDMNPFTGGCHYSNGCDKFTSNCSHCPQIPPHQTIDLGKVNLSIKSEALANRDIYIAADSIWLMEEAKKSSLFKKAKSINCIHYGINHEVYFPKNKVECRKAMNLKLDDDEYVICFGADYIADKRKGMSELMQAIAIIDKKGIKITCVIFGAGEIENLENIKFVNYGSINNENMLSLIYNLADLFIMPSLEEAFGQTCLEAMMCGIPLVGFDTGGIPDMIKNNETGYLAKKGDFVDLADKIYTLLIDKSKREQFAINARELGLKSFKTKHQAEKYFNLYSNIVTS